MKRKSSRGKLVRVHGKDIPPHTERDIARLKRAARKPIDTSDIPELTDDFWRHAVRPIDRFPRIPVKLDIDRDIANTVKKAGIARVNDILRRHLAAARGAASSGSRKAG